MPNQQTLIARTAEALIQQGIDSEEILRRAELRAPEINTTETQLSGIVNDLAAQLKLPGKQVTQMLASEVARRSEMRDLSNIKPSVPANQKTPAQETAAFCRNFFARRRHDRQACEPFRGRQTGPGRTTSLTRQGALPNRGAQSARTAPSA